MDDKLFLDFETRSAVDLKQCGLRKYAMHPSTDILCTGWAFNDERPIVSKNRDIHPRVRDHVAKGGKVVAHNSPFELNIWEYVGHARYLWPEFRPEQSDCTMARAYAMQLPGALDNCAAAVALDMRKDMKGYRVMLNLSQPRSRLPGECRVCGGSGEDGIEACEMCFGSGCGYVWWEPEDAPEKFETLYAYCPQDIVVTQALDKRLLPLSPIEKKIWLMDFHINGRGVAVDLRAAEKAMLIVQTEQRRLNHEIQRITGNLVASYNSHKQLKDWLSLRGVTTPGVAKNDVLTLLSDSGIPSDVRSALEVRQEAAKSSTAKLKAFVARACPDQRLRDGFQYHGAGATGRWAGRGVQVQNFPRPTISPDEIEEVFKVIGDRPPEELAEWISVLFGKPMTVMSDCLRGFLVAPPGKRFIAADFKAVEARKLAWLANHQAKLEIFRTHGRIYEFAASDIFGVPLSQIDKKKTPEMYQTGKTAELALGFQGGVGAFQQMAKTLGLKMAPVAQDLWKRSPMERRSAAKRGWEDRGVKSGIEKFEWIASELTKLAWREANQPIVDFWRLTEEAALRAVREPGVTHLIDREGPTVSYVVKGSFLVCRLPSGRRICYPYPTIKERETPWGEMKGTLRYMAEDAQSRKWLPQYAYGGLLVENITQASSRDLLAEAMLRSEERGYPIVLHAHDEGVTEVDDDDPITVRDYEKLYEELPAWAGGLPIAAEGWESRRYRK